MEENRNELPPDVQRFAPWKWKRRWRWATVGLLLLAMAYPLSMGPAYRLAKDGWLDVLDFENFYRPLMRVAHQRPELIPVVEWYVGLFAP